MIHSHLPVPHIPVGKTGTGKMRDRKIRERAMNRRMTPPLLLLYTMAAFAQTQNATRPPNYPQPVEGDFILRDFKFDSGETLPELKLHYRTIGELKRDASGVARNAILIMHGTGGSGAGFLSNQFGGALFGP